MNEANTKDATYVLTRALKNINVFTLQFIKWLVGLGV